MFGATNQYLHHFHWDCLVHFNNSHHYFYCLVFLDLAKHCQIPFFFFVFLDVDSIIHYKRFFKFTKKVETFFPTRATYQRHFEWKKTQKRMQNGEKTKCVVLNKKNKKTALSHFLWICEHTHTQHHIKPLRI